jgi:hypothetical protein
MVLAVRPPPHHPWTTLLLAVRPPPWAVCPCLRRWWFDRHLEWFDYGLRRSNHRKTVAGDSTARPFIACFIDLRRASCHAHAFDCAPRGSNDSTRATRGLGVHNSTHASGGSGIPALLASPSGYTRATGTTSTSVDAVGEGHTGGSSGQPSFDHVGKERLPAASRQTHLVGHLVVAALSGAHLCPCCPRRPILVPRHGGRI